MFKRVEKRRRKKEEEEELGLDEDMKDVLGIQDTDSDESDSESDSDQSSNHGKDQKDCGDGEKGNDGVGETRGRKRKRGTKDEDEDEEADDEADEETDEESEEDDGDLNQPTLTVQEALKDPLYIISLHPDVKGCIVCPGKLLKNIQMFNVHKTSKAHTRRFKLFTQLAAEAHSDENAWNVLQKEVPASPQPTEKLSKRAEKRNAKMAAIKAKREKQKAMKAKARTKKAAKAVGPSEDSTTRLPLKTAKPVQKKRKMDPTTGSGSVITPEKPSFSPVKTHKMIKRHPSQGVTEKQARPRSRRKIKAQSPDSLQTPRDVEKSSQRKGKSSSQTKEKVQG